MIIAVVHGGNFVPDEAAKIFLTLKTLFIYCGKQKGNFYQSIINSIRAQKALCKV
jgi:hypothetical protein